MVMHSNGHIGWVLRGKVHTGRARWDLRWWLGLPKQTAKSAVTALRLLLCPLRLFGCSRERKRPPAHTGGIRRRALGAEKG